MKTSPAAEGDPGGDEQSAQAEGPDLLRQDEERQQQAPQKDQQPAQLPSRIAHNSILRIIGFSILCGAAWSRYARAKHENRQRDLWEFSKRKDNYDNMISLYFSIIRKYTIQFIV